MTLERYFVRDKDADVTTHSDEEVFNVSPHPPTHAVDDAEQRAALLCQLRRPEAVRAAVAQGRVLPGTDISVAMDALHVRGLHPWIPPDPAAGPVLIVDGTPPDGPGVAVIGARASDPYGLSVASEAARDAVAAGHSVISGGAEGCDAAAHEAAIAAGGHTTVVLGAGHDRPYPAHHRDLFRRVVDSGGAVVSPYWPETPPARFRFLARNHIIAGLSAVVVVARARQRSGALSTAAAARKLDRPVLAVPGSVGEALSEGAHHLLATGARPMWGGMSLRQALGQSGGAPWPVEHRGQAAPWPKLPALAPPDELSPPARAIRAVLTGLGEADTDTLHREADVTVSELLGALLELELHGLVVRLPCGRVSVAGTEGNRRSPPHAPEIASNQS